MVRIQAGGNFSSRYISPCVAAEPSGDCGGVVAALTLGSGADQIWQIASAPGPNPLAEGSYIILGQTPIQFIATVPPATAVLAADCNGFRNIGCGLPIVISNPSNFTASQYTFTLTAA